MTLERQNKTNMVLNENQHSRLKKFMSHFLFTTENYLKLGPNDASIVLNSIIDDTAYNNEFTKIQESTLISAVNHFRSILHHERPQDVNIEEYEISLDGTNGLSQLNDNTAAGITRSDVVRFITDSIENELVVQQRILKRNKTVTSKKNTTPVTPTEKMVTPQFSPDIQSFWNDMVSLFDTETKFYQVAFETLNKWFGDEDMDFMTKIETELLKYQVQCSVQAPDDVETMLTIKLCIILARIPSDERTVLQDQCLEELENGAPLTNKNRQRNLQVLLYCVRGLSIEEPQVAIEALNKAIALDSTYALALTCRANVYRANEKFDEALRDYTAALSIYPPCAIKGRAEVLAIMGKLEESLKDWKLALEYFPESTEVLIQYGVLNQTLGNYEAAYDAFTKANEINPKFAGAIRHKADILFAMGSYEEALYDLDRSIQIEPMSIPYVTKAHMYQVMNRPKEAVDNAKKALALNNDEPSIEKASKLVFVWAERQSEKPIQHHHQVISYLISNSVPVYGITNIWNKLIGATMKAFIKPNEYPEFLNDAIDETKMYWKTFMEPYFVTSIHTAQIQIAKVGELYYKSHLFLIVERDILRLCENLNSNQEAVSFLLLARCLLPDINNEVDMIQKLLQYFKLRYDENPNDQRIKHAYILSLYVRAWKYASSKFDLAILDFINCIDLDPTLVKAYIGLAISLHSYEKSQDALNAISTGIEIDDQFEEAIYFKGLIQYDIKDYNGSHRSLTEAMKLEMKNNQHLTSKNIFSPYYQRSVQLIETMVDHIH
jgi:tetratricopeptide (TPR) repeat protein